VTGIPSVVKLFGVMDLVHTEWSTARYYAKNVEQLAALKYRQDVWIVLDDGTRGGDILRARDSRRAHSFPSQWNGPRVDGAKDRPRASAAKFAVPPDAKVVLFLRDWLIQTAVGCHRSVRSRRAKHQQCTFDRRRRRTLRMVCERSVKDAGLSAGFPG
jgi:hypothetical protein